MVLRLDVDFVYKGVAFQAIGGMAFVRVTRNCV